MLLPTEKRLSLPAMMIRLRILLSIVLLLGCTPARGVQHEGDSDAVPERRTLTDGFWGLHDSLADYGIQVGLNLTSIYQLNMHGGMSTHRRAGRFAGSYDLELAADLERLLGFERTSLYVHAEGLWSKSGGIDTPAVGSAFGVNADGATRRSIDVTELWFERSLVGDAFIVRIGKIDLTGGFDCRGCPVAFDSSLFANDETSQFLNGALVNNPTIPFPENGLGIAAFYKPGEKWYVAAGIADAQSDVRETGFRTALHDEDYFFYIFETGVTPAIDSADGPLQGAYRFGFWSDPQPKSNSDKAKTERDDLGFYVSCDQVLTKENDDPTDSQGLGIFARYGHADGRKNDITNFWSIGFQYQGLLDGRDEDVLGVGFAKGIFSDAASTTYPQDYESVVELYYNARISSYIDISPSIQYIANPGGAAGVRDAVVFGVRVQVLF